MKKIIVLCGVVAALALSAGCAKKAAPETAAPGGSIKARLATAAATAASAAPTAAATATAPGGGN